MNCNSKHPEKSAKHDIRVIAQCLLCSGSITLHSGQTAKYEIIDVLKIGAIHVASKAIVNFNRSIDYGDLESDEDKTDKEDEDKEGKINEKVSQFFAPDYDDQE